jgi:gas vesicle protein
MRNLVSLLLGLSIGAVVAVVLVYFFAPTYGEQLVARLKQGWQDSLAEARKASRDRKAELQAELAGTPPKPQ